MYLFCQWLLPGEFTGHRWFPRTKCQKRGKYFHLMTSSCMLYLWPCCLPAKQRWASHWSFRITKEAQSLYEERGEFPAQRPMTRNFDVSLICVWTNGWVNNHKAGDLRRYRAHYDVTVMDDPSKRSSNFCISYVVCVELCLKYRLSLCNTGYFILGIHVPVVWNLHIQSAPDFIKWRNASHDKLCHHGLRVQERYTLYLTFYLAALGLVLNETNALCIRVADNCISQGNLSNYDTSNRFGTHFLQGSHCRKMTWATQNFNMSAIFHDGCHGLPWNPIFAMKWHQMVEKDHSDNKVCVLRM